MTEIWGFYPDYEIRSGIRNLENALKQITAFDEALKAIKKVEFYVTANFDATEHFTWVGDCYLVLHTDIKEPFPNEPDNLKRLVVRCHTWWFGDAKTKPQEVMENLKKYSVERDNCPIHFNPEEWQYETGNNKFTNCWIHTEKKG